MKVSKKNTGQKLARNVVILFSEEKRKDYVTGFRKRKNERKERAVVYNEAKAKKEKVAARTQRRKQAQALLDAYEENAVKQKEILDAEFSSSDDSDDDVQKTEVQDHGGVTLTNTVTTQCGDATVEIATLGLSTNHFLGSNADFSSCKLDSSTIRRHGHALNLGRHTPLPKKAEPEDQSFSDLVKDVMKKVKKKAKKTGDKLALKPNFKKDNNKVKKKPKSEKKKPLVTEL